MKQKKLKEEGEHEIHITVTIAKASLTDNDFDAKKNDLPQVQNYFHCQYKLLPDDKDYVKTDVVTFGMAAKMYGDSNDSKVLRTWLEGNKTWVAWTSNRKLRVTQETLLKMFKHKIELKLWDTKNKVSAKARFDRPKAFRLPQTKATDEVDLDIIRELLHQEGKTNVHLGVGLLSQSTVVNDGALKKDVNKNVSFFNAKSQMNVLTPNQSNSSEQLIATSDSKLEVQVRLDKNKQPEFKNLLMLASSGIKPLAVDMLEVENENISLATVNSAKSSKAHDRGNKSAAQHTLDSVSSTVKKLDAEAEKIHQNGLSSITIPLSALFTNCTSISNNIKEPVSTIEEVIIIITLDKPLLSDRQREVLNPMVLTVGSASEMPDNTMPFDDLAVKCLPPYIKYTFHECPLHTSEETDHGKTLKFNDRNVILLGVKPKEKLFEYLRGPPLKIEVHDRDPKQVPIKKSLVFGTMPHDNEICSVHYTGAVTCEAEESSYYNISYGVAEFDLSELISGERILHLIAPIRNCHKQLIDSNGNKLLLNTRKSTGIPPGDYLEFGSDLKIKIELARSLTDDPVAMVSPTKNASLPPNLQNECPYNRMIYIFDYHNKAFLGELLKQVSQINATALDLASYPQHVIEAALSTYKLSDKQMLDTSLNIITGCQIIDGAFHIFILEGLHDDGIKTLWNVLDHPPPKEDTFFRVLYNSDMSFAQRLYLLLDVDLTRVRLYQPLSAIVKQPLLYVRDMIPKFCFDAVTKLYQLCECTSLQNAARNEIIPTAEMIVSLAKEFGVPLRPDDFHEIVPTALSIDKQINAVCIEDEIVTLSVPPKRELLDIHNEKYENMLLERKSLPQKNYVNANIKSLVALSQLKSAEKQDIINDTPHRASADIAVKQILRAEIDKSQWKTKNGFVFPGVKSSAESNSYPKPIHPARLEELALPWHENILHANLSKPIVDRIIFGYEDRNLDFDTLSKPPDFFGQPLTVTIHAAGDTLENEVAAVRKDEEKSWKEKLVVDDTQFKTYRCLPATEMVDKGPKASNQQSRLQPFLKEEPQKYSLAQKGMYLKPIPGLSVVSQPYTDENGDYHSMEYPDNHKVLETNLGFHPGEIEGFSLSRDENVIPAKHYSHNYFKNTKGCDFRLVHTNRKKNMKKVKPLSHEERETHLFY